MDFIQPYDPLGVAQVHSTRGGPRPTIPKRMLPSLLSGASAEDPHDAAAFDAYARALTAQLGALMTLFMVAATVLWWPLDGLVSTEPRYVSIFRDLRLAALAVEVVAFVGFLLLRRAPKAAIPFGILCYAAFLAAVGYHLGRLNDLSLFADAYLGVVPIAVIPVDFRRRVPATVLIASALPAAYFLPFPENIQAPNALAQLSFLFFAVLFSVTLGELVYRVQRREFIQGRALDRANEALAEMAESLSDQVAEQTQQLRGLALHLEQVQESERRRIAQDLHDDLGQGLTAMRYALARLENHVDAAAGEVHELLADLNALTDGTTRAVRSVITELRPRILDDVGLAAAAEWLCTRVGDVGRVECRLEIDASFPDDDDVHLTHAALVLFRVIQEGTTNALKHAHSARIVVRLRCDGGRIGAEVEDDGVGCDPDQPTEGFGLLGLTERVRALDGELVIRPRAGGGTRLAAWVPATAEPHRVKSA